MTWRQRILAKIDDIEKFLDDKVKDLDMAKKRKIMGPLYNLISNLEKFDESKKTSGKSGINPISLELYLAEISEGGGIDKTSFNIFTKLPHKPYAKSTTSSTVVLSHTKDEKKYEEQIDVQRVFTQLLPGQVTQRWGFEGQYRIPCGRYSRAASTNYVSNLKSLTGIHEISEQPIPNILVDGQPVHRLEKLSAISLQTKTGGSYIDPETGEEKSKRRGIPLCPVCLSIDIKSGKAPERCNHVEDGTSTPEPRSSIYASPDLQNIEIKSERKIEQSNQFTFPLNEMFEKIEFVEKTKILTIAKGFSRNMGATNVYVKYNPFLGYTIDTCGVLFTLKEISQEFIEDVIENKDVTVRDIVIDVLVERIKEILKDLNRSSMEVELWLSATIKSLELDSITKSFDYKEINNKLADTSFENNFNSKITDELQFYERDPPGLDPVNQAQAISNVSSEISKIRISEDDLKSKIKSLIKNSLCYLLHQSGLVTSGSTSQDIGFVTPTEDSNEILIYDNVHGGNGASKLINDYLIGQHESYSPLHGVRPKYFQEVFFELLQPCSQGTADRIFFQNLENAITKSSNNFISEKIDEIKQRKQNSNAEYEYIENLGIQNMFPLSIGKRSLPTETNENKIIQEAANICVHGCFECALLLGNYSGIGGPKLERYNTSKNLIDLYFRFQTDKIRIDYDQSVNEIIAFLKKNNMVIISKRGSQQNGFDDLIAKMNLLIGEEEDNKLVKFSGLWFDCPILDSAEVEMTILLAMVDIPKEIQ